MSDETNLLQVSDFKYNILINYEIQKKKKKKKKKHNKKKKKKKKKKKAVVSRQNIFLTSPCAQMFSSLSVNIDSRGLVHPFWTIHSRKKSSLQNSFSSLIFKGLLPTPP